MQEITFGPLNFSDPNEIRRAAEIHESAPLNWDPSYVVRPERVQNWCQFLTSAARDSSLFVVTAKTQAAELIGLHWLQMTERYDVRCGHVQSLWVAETHRQSGIGRELKSRGEQWAKSQGAKFVVTEVFYANQKMIDFNLKQGFSARQLEMIKDL